MQALDKLLLSNDLLSYENNKSANLRKLMKKICINNRDEMIILFVDNIAYIMADGNYTKICYIGGLSTVLSLGISKIEAMLSQAYPKGTTSPFIRLGRSVIINQMFLYDINVLKQHLVLSDCLKNSVTLKLPKPLLKKYKDMVNRSSSITLKK